MGIARLVRKCILVQSRAIVGGAGAVAHRVDNDLIVISFVEDDVWEGRRAYAPNRRIRSHNTCQRILPQQFGDRLNRA